MGTVGAEAGRKGPESLRNRLTGRAGIGPTLFCNSRPSAAEMKKPGVQSAGGKPGASRYRWIFDSETGREALTTVAVGFVRMQRAGPKTQRLRLSELTAPRTPSSPGSGG